MWWGKVGEEAGGGIPGQAEEGHGVDREWKTELEPGDIPDHNPVPEAFGCLYLPRRW